MNTALQRSGWILLGGTLALLAQSRTLAPPSAPGAPASAGDLHVGGSLYVAGPHPWTDARAFGVRPTAVNVGAKLQAAIDSVAGSGGGVVVVPPGDYELEQTLVVKEGVELRLGAGVVCWETDMDPCIELRAKSTLRGTGGMPGPEGGTEIVCRGPATASGIEYALTSDYFSRNQLFDLRVEADPGNAPGRGISVNLPNFTRFSNVAVLGFPDAGFEILGAIYFTLEFCFAGGCGVGVRFDSGTLQRPQDKRPISITTDSGVRIEQLAVDNATSAGLHFRTGNPGVTNVHVDGYRYEAGDGFSGTAVEIESFNNAQVHLENFATWRPEMAPGGGSAVVVSGSNGVALSGSNWSIQSAKYANILDDQVAGTLLSLAGFAPLGRVRDLSYQGGLQQASINQHFLGQLELRNFNSPTNAVTLRTGPEPLPNDGPNGSLYLLQRAGAGATLYVRENDSWVPK